MGVQLVIRDIVCLKTEVREKHDLEPKIKCPGKLPIKSSGKLRTFLATQDLENFTTRRQSYLKDLHTIYSTKQQRNSRKRKSETMKQNI